VGSVRDVESIGTDREQRIRWRHRLPRGAPVERHAVLLDEARGRRVVHVGFVDELAASKLAQGVWLHGRLAEVASSLVGLDADDVGVAWARGEGFEAYAVDAQSPEAVAALGLEAADVVIAGEIVEHLDAPGPFLRAMRRLVSEGGTLVLTTPNAYRLLNFLAPLSGSELVHPDHTSWQSPRTLQTLLERSGWDVVRMAYYRNPRRRLDRGGAGYVKGEAANVARSLVGAFGRLAPFWSDGIVAWAHPRRDGGGASG
jgi:SAM-dependent methyltransferase